MSLALPDAEAAAAAADKVVVGTHCYPTHQVAFSSFLLLLLLVVVVYDGNSPQKVDTAVADHSYCCCYCCCYNSRSLVVVVVVGCTGRNSLQMMPREEEEEDNDGDEVEGVGFYHLSSQRVEKVDLTLRQDHPDHLMELLLLELLGGATSYRHRHTVVVVVAVVEMERDRMVVEELAAAFAVGAAFGVLYRTLYE